MRKEYQTPEIEIIEFDTEVQMLMTISGGGGTAEFGDNDANSDDLGWEF